LAAASTVKRTLLALALGGGAGLGLVSTNPGPAEFETFAADQLTRLVSDELCQEDGLPMMARLLVQDCPALVASQRGVLGRLASLHTRRRNLGLMSLYSTELGGQQVLPSWRMPRYHALTLAAAGRFVLLQAGERKASELEPERSTERSAEGP
jgi:hypothetical protein